MEERVTVESWEQFVAFAEVLMRNVFGLRQPVRSSLTGVAPGKHLKIKRVFHRTLLYHISVAVKGLQL